jgi:integration host factor subunit beta
MMLKSDLVDRIAAQNPYLYKRDVENAVDVILDEIAGALYRGDRVKLSRFGTFSVRTRPARAGRDPRTGGYVAVDQKLVPFFTVSKKMHERLNRPNSPDAPQ